MQNLASMMTAHLIGYYLTDTVTITRPDASVSTYKANVQHRREAISSEDPSDARTTERTATVVYLEPTAVVSVGSTCMYDGKRHNVSTVTPGRTAENYVRIEIDREQLATALVSVTFTRRTPDKTWETIGTFTVQQTIDNREPLDQSRASVFDAQTARGSLLTGVLAGSSELDVVQVGDWFTLDDLPGRVVFVDRSNSERIELSYRLEQRAA